MKETELADSFKTGYSSKQVITAIVLAFVLHGSILAGYFVLGGEKKSHTKAAPTDKDKKDGDKNTAAKPGDGKPAEPADGVAKTNEAPVRTTPNPDTKNADVAKPSELPKAPDSDIDSILKAK